MYGARWGQLLGNRTGVAVGTSDQAWDPAATEGPLTLSAHDTVVSVQAPGAVIGDGTYGVISQGAGEVYWEIVYFSNPGGSDSSPFNCGLIDSGGTIGDFDEHMVIAASDGSIYGNSLTLGGWVLPSEGDIICLYANLDTWEFKVRRNGGSWNGVGAPSLDIEDVTGIDISYMGPMVFPYLDIRLNAGGCAVAKFSPSQWVYPPPIGAGEWVGGGAPAGFQGIGDVVTGAALYWGMRAYDSASIGTNALMISRVDTATADIVTVAGGGLDTTAIEAFRAADTVSPGAAIRIIKEYDQVASADAPVSVCIYTATGINGTPECTFDSFFGSTTGITGPTLSQPFSVIMVVKNTAFTASDQVLGNDGQPHFGFSAANTAQLYGGSAVGTVGGITDGTYHSLQVVFNGASSFVSINGATPVTVSANPGTNGLSGLIYLGTDASAGQTFRGGLGELAIYAGDVVTANRAAIYANHSAYFGV